ncbi:MAG: Holliday junction branch migration protein RuvA [Dehalococcoidia bacterium]|nr:Holliday junction branch migration protein RuvA [Dehalococcoidia bacterium]
MPVARLRGVVEEAGDDWVIVGVGGLGMLVSVPAPAAEALTAGARAELFTHLHVREDALTLYGFTSVEELRLFEQLIGVSGIGPRAALALLSSLDYAQLTLAIVGGQVDALRRVPGIGQKTAERLVLELRDKVTPPAAAEAARPAAMPERDGELIAALLGLGYSQPEATAAAGRVDGAGLPLEDRVRAALQYFAG